MHAVKIGSSISRPRLVSHGVPQGSVLGPIMFLVYINDLPNVSNIAHFTLFADDTTLSHSNNDYGNLIRDVSSTAGRVFEWTVNNRLSLNTEKTSAILFTNRLAAVESPRMLNIKGVSVSFDDSFKFLGIQIDNKLKFSGHINLICSKLSKTAGILYRVRDFVPGNVLLKLYHSLVYPYLLYGILLWGGTCSVHLNPLRVVQKRILKTITHSHILDHSAPIFNRTKILNLDDIYNYHLGIYMYKLELSNSLSNPQHSYCTRYGNRALSEF